MFGPSKTKYLLLSLVTSVALTSGCGSDSSGPGGLGGSRDSAIATGSGGSTGSDGATLDADKTGIDLATATGGAQTTGADGAINLDGATSFGGATGSGGATGNKDAIGTGGTTVDGGAADLNPTTDTRATPDSDATIDAPSVDAPVTIDGGTSASVVCKPAGALINDFSSDGCSYGAWGNGEMNTIAWTTTQGTSTIAATCGSSGMVFSGTLGAASDTNDNVAGFGLSLQGSVMSSGADLSQDCTLFDLSAYSGLSMTLSSASGAVSGMIVSIDLADAPSGQKQIAVPRTPATVNITCADLGISSAAAAHVVGLAVTFVNGATAATADLVVTRFGLL